MFLKGVVALLKNESVRFDDESRSSKTIVVQMKYIPKYHKYIACHDCLTYQMSHRRELASSSYVQV